MNRISVVNKEAAWAIVNRLFPSDYDKDEVASTNAGYPIYRHNALNPENRICDLGCRLEVNLGNDTINIWIENPEADEAVKDAKKARYMQKEAEKRAKEYAYEIDGLRETIACKDDEIVRLKAKLYDFIEGVQK